jgi:O-antigen biosynthesis protein
VPNLPVVVVFSPKPVALQSPEPLSTYETRELDCRCYPSDETLDEILVRDRPDVIVSRGRVGDFSRLQKAPYAVRRKWLHFDESIRLEKVGEAAFKLFVRNLFSRSAGAPLVSVFTPTYRTGARLRRPFESLRRQSFTNWEWVVVDDSDDGGATLAQLREMAEQEHRMAVHAAHRHSGVIGELKRRACLLAHGEMLVELDHDDELTPDALDLVVCAFARFPEAGFVYSDWAEVDEATGESLSYGDTWAFGYGSYRPEERDGKLIMVANAPNLNPKTIRHIVGVPNHLRAWRGATYLEIGGHNPGIHVADDYELLIRTFLHTRMVRVPKLAYIQYLGGGNTQDVRRQEIQRLVRVFAEHYHEPIHARLQELGIDDYVWRAGEGRPMSLLDLVPNPPVEQHATLLAD